MQLVYDLSKFLHVAAVIVWLGGVTAVGIVNARLAREGDRSAQAALGRASRFFGGAVVGPAAGLTLVAGLVMTANAGLSLATLWVAWGIGALLVSTLLGVTVLRRDGEELARQPDGARASVLQRRLRAVSAGNLLLLFSAVAAMVFKPTL